MIHATAVVDSACELGRDVEIGPFAVIEGDARIGDGCAIGPHAVIMRHTTLGPGCRVHAGAVLGDLPQDLAFEPCESSVRIGANCVIREGVTVHRGTKPGTWTEIGSDCFLMAFSHFAHNVRLGPRVIVANGSLLAGYVEVDERAFISGNCVVHQFCKIGRVAMIGGSAAVTKDVPPYCMVGTRSLNRVCGLNVVGMRRAGLSAEERRQVKQAFDAIYRSGLNVRQALEKLGRLEGNGPAREFTAFAERSTRGFCGLSGGE